MVENEFSDTDDTAEEGGTIVSKVGGRLCITTGGSNLVGRGCTKSKGGFHGRIGINDVAQRSVRLMVVGGKIS